MQVGASSGLSAQVTQHRSSRENALPHRGRGPRVAVRYDVTGGKDALSRGREIRSDGFQQCLRPAVSAEATERSEALRGVQYVGGRFVASYLKDAKSLLDELA